MRSKLVMTLVSIAILASGLVFPIALTAAREATPAIGSVGVSGGAVGSGEPTVAPGYVLSLRRGVFEPGGLVSLHHHPGALVIFVASGALTYSVFAGEALVTRAAEEGTPVLTEQIGPGAATLLQPGDSVYEDGVVHVTENEGDEPAVIWIAALLAADQPGTQLHEVATPAPAAS